MEAKVEIREEFTVLTPGGGEMYSHRDKDDLRPLKEGNFSRVAIYSTKGAAILAAQKLNEALRDNGIDDRSYPVAMRTVTTVTTAWDDSV